MEVEEDGPLEEWTLKELKEECKRLGLSEKGKKAQLIERIKEARDVEEVSSVEKAVHVEEDVLVEDSNVEQVAPIEKATPMDEESVAVEKTAPDADEPENMEVEEDGPLEEWTLKELKEECKTLGISEKGKKAQLIERIKEVKTATIGETATDEQAVPSEEVAALEERVSTEENALIEETATVEEAAPAGEKTSPVDEGEANEPESMEVEEDGPLEEWTLKELKEECKVLGLSEKGKKAQLIERIKEAKSANVGETVPFEEAA